LNQVAKLKKIFRIKAEELEKARKANKDAKLIRQKQVLRKAGATLREAVNKLNGQLERQMKMQCRSFCEAMHEKLPQELRDMVVRHIITDRNVTSR
jgi:type II secretory pathway component PulF